MSDKNPRQDIMLCYPFEERRLLEPKFKWTFPVIVQPKLDGERCRALCADGNISLVSSQLNFFRSVPHIIDALRDMDLGVVELDGELYHHGMDFPSIHSIVSRTAENLHPSRRDIELHVFDMVRTDTRQAERLVDLFALLNAYLADYPQIKLVESRVANSLPEIMEIFNEYISKGYEGIIVRDPGAIYVRKRSNRILKFKPKKVDHYIITAVNEAVSGEGSAKEMVGSFTCRDYEGNIFGVGAGNLSHERRKFYWEHREMLIGKTCVVQYQHLTPSGVPRFGLCVQVVD
jgi:ATP-dependent DNA ligase